MFGYMGKVLRVNLTAKKFVNEPLKEEVIRKFIGGRGFGAWTLWNEISPRIDPLSSENKLVISLGPLTATKAQGAHKWMAQFKSPLTGTYFRSVGGGFFGAELKFAGYDAIIVEGRAEKPTYLYICDDKVELKDAERIWGMTTNFVPEFIKEETDENAKITMIGPAGERLVRIAAIVTDDMRSASRGGGGAVMGSKNLKAIAVKGTKKPEIYDEKTFNEAVREQVEQLRKSPAFDSLHSLGTDGAPYVEYISGCFPTYNFRQEELLNVEVFKPENLDRYVVKHYGCYGCMVRCGKIFKITEGPYSCLVCEMPEYEAHWSLGGNLGNTNVESIIYANMLADIYGLDVMSTGVAISFAMELYEKGIIGKSETDGLKLRWGDPEIIPELVKKIALRIGIGNMLAEGVRRTAEIIGRGAEKYAMHVKGLELPGHDPRRAKSRGLSVATSPIGASHTMGGGVSYEEHGAPYKGNKVDPFTTEGKGEMTIQTQIEHAAVETGIWCVFIPALLTFDTAIELYSKLLYAATGIGEFKNPSNLLLAGERIFNIERTFNVREGVDGSYDRMPERIVKEPIPRNGPSKGQIFEEEIMLKDYYRACGWDERGVPTKRKLGEIGLENVAEELKI